MNLCRKAFSISLLVVALAACDKGTPDAVQSAPRIDFECSHVQAMGCNDSNSDKPVFMGLDENTAVRCGYQLAYYQGENLIKAFTYSSQTTTGSNGSVLVGLATHWVNSLSMPVLQLDKKNYKLCAFIDLNENQTLDRGEPVSESLFTLGTSILPISNWSNY